MADTRAAAADGAPPAAKRIRLDTQLQRNAGPGSQVQVSCIRHCTSLLRLGPVLLQSPLGVRDLICLLHTALQPAHRSPTVKADSAGMPGAHGGITSAKRSPSSAAAQGRPGVPVSLHAGTGGASTMIPQSSPETLLHGSVICTAGNACLSACFHLLLYSFSSGAAATSGRYQAVPANGAGERTHMLPSCPTYLRLFTVEG